MSSTEGMVHTSLCKPRDTSGSVKVGVKRKRKICILYYRTAVLLLHHSCIIQLHPSPYDGNTRKSKRNGDNCPNSEMRDGRNCVRTSGWEGTTGQTVSIGTGNSRDGNKTQYGGMVDGGNRNQRRDGQGTRGRERTITWFPVPVPYRSRPDHISHPDLYRAYPC